MSGRAESADARTAAGSGAGARTCAGHIARSSVRQQIVAVCGELCVASCVWQAGATVCEDPVCTAARPS